jgi:GT2 family glycosyltransferase
LSDIYKFLSGEDIEVILINDASIETDCVTGVAWWQKQVDKTFPILYHTNSENVGFGHSMNNGAKIANGEVLIFYSNDITCSGNFIPELKQLLAKNDKVLIGNEVIWFPGGWNEFDIEGKHIVIPYANGWFLACTREVWINIGGFDWKTYGKMDFEDVDVSTRAMELGYNIVALDSKKIVHAHQGSTISSLNIDRMAITQKNKVKFFAKWGSRLADIHETMEKNRHEGNRKPT